MTAILTDIEGTTSSISFVKDVLFPYAASHLPGFVRQHARRDDVAELIEAIQVSESLTDIDAVVDQCMAWMEADNKQTQLKALQGLIWKTGYEQGDYQAHVYEDAYRYIRQWHQAGIPVYIYSSGSVYAQKLFFRYSCFGDMTDLFSGFFDTTTGPKLEADSYVTISAAIGKPPAGIVFLSDVLGELDAAHAAGMATVHVQREKGMSSGEIHRVAHSFAEIQPD